MCRSIVTLRGEEPATDDEVQAAALQFIRKVSGQRAPSRANQEAFDRAVHEVTEATRRLLDDFVTPPGAKPPAMAHSRVLAREKAAARAATTAADTTATTTATTAATA
jgi:hypothetical protein